MKEIEKLKTMFENYENSHFFIDCCTEAFLKSGQSVSKAKWFVNKHFQSYNDCDLIQLKKCSAHWNNVSYDKLNQFDFLNYKMTIHTLSNYRMVIKIMEDCLNYQEL
jgi:hypothetical protein